MQSKRTRANRRAAAGTLLALLLTACASTPPAPVEDIALADEAPRPSVPARTTAADRNVATHKVVTGDTLAIGSTLSGRTVTAGIVDASGAVTATTGASHLVDQNLNSGPAQLPTMSMQRAEFRNLCYTQGPADGIPQCP